MWKISNLFKKSIKNKENDDSIDDGLLDDDIKEKDKKYDFLILRSKAIEIAKKNENLKTDFCRNSNRHNITFLYFSKWKVDVVELNEKKYWQIQILGGDVSGREFLEDATKNWDGHFIEEDLKLLRCLIDVETGEYIYYPDEINPFLVKVQTDMTGGECIYYPDEINPFLAKVQTDMTGEYTYYPDESEKKSWKDIMNEMLKIEEMEKKENNGISDLYAKITEEELDRREKYQKQNKYSVYDLIDSIMGNYAEDEEDNENKNEDNK